MNPAGGDQQTLPRPAAAPVTAARVPGVTGAELMSRFPPRPAGRVLVGDRGRSIRRSLPGC